MAHVSLTVRRDNGVTVTANGEVPDVLIADIAMTLGAILFDASAVTALPAEETVPEQPTPTPEAPTDAPVDPVDPATI